MALSENIDRLSEDHENAKPLAKRLREAGFAADLDCVQTKLVMAYLAKIEVVQKRSIERCQW